MYVCHHHHIYTLLPLQFNVSNGKHKALGAAYDAAQRRPERDEDINEILTPEFRDRVQRSLGLHDLLNQHVEFMQQADASLRSRLIQAGLPLPKGYLLGYLLGPPSPLGLGSMPQDQSMSGVGGDKDKDRANALRRLASREGGLLSGRKGSTSPGGGWASSPSPPGSRASSPQHLDSPTLRTRSSRAAGRDTSPPGCSGQPQQGRDGGSPPPVSRQQPRHVRDGSPPPVSRHHPSLSSPGAGGKGHSGGAERRSQQQQLTLPEGPKLSAGLAPGDEELQPSSPGPQAVVLHSWDMLGDDVEVPLTVQLLQQLLEQQHAAKHPLSHSARPRTTPAMLAASSSPGTEAQAEAPVARGLDAGEMSVCGGGEGSQGGRAKATVSLQRAPSPSPPPVCAPHSPPPVVCVHLTPHPLTCVCTSLTFPPACAFRTS